MAPPGWTDLKWSGREDLNFSTRTIGFSRSPCKPLNSKACFLYLCRSVVALGHIWTQNLREHIAEHRCDSTIILSDHVRIATLVLHSERHSRVVLPYSGLNTGGLSWASDRDRSK